MTSQLMATDRDLHTMLRIVLAPDRDDEPTEGVPWSVLFELKELIPCNEIWFNGHDVEREEPYFEQNTTPVESRPNSTEEIFWLYYWESMCSYPDRTGDLRSITMTSDPLTDRKFRETPMYLDHFRQYGLEYAMSLCLPGDGPSRTVRLHVVRGPGPDFSERDRTLMMLLRPHLHDVYLREQRRRHQVPELTARQWQLLRLLNAGHSNIQIARRLAVRPGTVRKHLENIYERLQVTNRTAALARAFPERLDV